MKQEARTRPINDQIAEALKHGKQLEIDCARILKPDEYVMPPMMKGHIACDGNEVADISEEKDIATL